MKAIAYLVLSLTLASCGANYHLRKAEKHLLLAESKGAKIKSDTVFKEIEVERVRVDTVVNNVPLEKLLHDTITVVQKDQVVKIKYQEKEKKVYVKVNSTKPKYIRVPVIVTKKISAGHSNWDMAILGWVALLIGFLIGVIYKSRKTK